MKFSLTLLTLVPLVAAHFTLDYPATRGFDEDLEPRFCGGFNQSATRQPFPLGNAPILIDSHHPSAQVAILISFDAAPTAFNQFNQTSGGTGYPMLMPFGSITGEGEYCFTVDVAALAVAGVGNGTLATIQVEFNGGDGQLFQCADVVLLSNFTPSNVSCTNVSTPAVSSSSGAASATGSAPSAPSSSAKSGTGRNLAAVGSALAGMVGVAVLVL